MLPITPISFCQQNDNSTSLLRSVSCPVTVCRVQHRLCPGRVMGVINSMGGAPRGRGRPLWRWSGSWILVQCLIGSSPHLSCLCLLHRSSSSNITALLCTCVRMHTRDTYMWGPDGSLICCPRHHLPSLLFHTGSLAGLGLTSGRSGWPASPKGPFVSVSPTLHMTVHGFFPHSAWVLGMEIGSFNCTISAAQKRLVLEVL